MTGKAWVVGPNVDTDALAPGKYMHLDLSGIAQHCLEDMRPDFAPNVRPGDVLVGGENFGIGSSREQAAAALGALGLKAVIAPSFAGIFYRNAFNLGLPALICAEAAEIAEGALVEVDLAAGEITLSERGLVLRTPPLPPILRDLVAAGGLINHLKSRTAGAAIDQA